MKTLSINQQGIAHLAVLLVLSFTAVAGFAGYKVMEKNRVANGDVSSSVEAEVPATITTQADLEATTKALDSSSTQVDSGLNDSQLDADMNDML